ncbi:MAG: 50S ribosomal protein L28 [Candidatus Omnitrophica bacterium]|nr:50S ribosomal protein L28 [Candidatus Omnitrophota bacterium]
MSRRCQICGVGPVAGRTIVRKGMAKKKGGVGRKVTRTTKRVFLPNLQKIKVLINGAAKSILVCTRCIKAGKIQKA